MTAQDVAILAYNITLIPVIAASLFFLILSMISLLSSGKPKPKFEKLKELPFVSIQIATYNDPIAKRCVEKCLQFEYPKDRYEIVIADDSTNEQTQKMLSDFEKQNPGIVKYCHRNNRNGFKAGALKEAMKVTKGEYIAVFDSDWVPEKDWLIKAIQPFSNPKIGLVQTMQGFYNNYKNLITRFAAYTLTVYHTIILPINSMNNAVLFCGTGGIIRRKAFEEAGGWNPQSLTEDSELSVKILAKGYKSVYLEIETPSEVPETIEGFVKQQMRWCYGNTRIFFDNAPLILYKRGLSLKQRITITLSTLGNAIAPIIILMTIFGYSGWFLGEITLLGISDLISLAGRFLMTSGFLVIAFMTLHRKKTAKEFPYLVLALFSMGVVLAIANSVAFTKAILNIKLQWFCTPKSENEGVV